MLIMNKNTTQEFDNYQRALFREVTEDVEKEQLFLFWKKYSKKIIIYSSAFLFVMFSVFSFLFYQNWKTEKNALIYTNALEESLYDSEVSNKMFQQLINDNHDGFALLAKIEQAALLLNDNDKTQGFQALKNIANDNNIASPFRNLAVIVLGYHLLDEEGTEKEIISLITPLADDNNLWRGSAREILALLALKSEDKDNTVTLLQKNIDDNKLPDSFKTRAKEMLSVLLS